MVSTLIKQLVVPVAAICIVTTVALAQIIPGSGIEGTKFRGLALNQTPAQSVAALEAIGLRCMTLAEKTALVDDGVLFLENYQTEMGELEVCRIVSSDFRLEDEVGGHGRYRLLVAAENLSQTFLYAVIFEQNTAVGLFLQPSFFAADLMSLNDFVSSVWQSYGITGSSLNESAGVWAGTTTQGEIVRIASVLNNVANVLIVHIPLGSDTPTFN